MQQKKSDVLIIIPAYNEEGSIENVVNEIKESYKEFDYVIINDGSKDRTKEICEHNNYNMIDLPINLGLAGGFRAGMKYAYKENYKYAVQFDADGQHRPEYISKMKKVSEKGVNIVIASRFVTETKPFSLRMIGSRMISFAIKLTTGTKVYDPTSGMRMYDSKMIKECATNINYGPEPDTVSFLIKNGATVEEIQSTMEERTTGESYLSAFKSISYMIRMLLSILVIQNFRKRG